MLTKTRTSLIKTDSKNEAKALGLVVQLSTTNFHTETYDGEKVVTETVTKINYAALVTDTTSIFNRFRPRENVIDSWTKVNYKQWFRNLLWRPPF